MANAKNLVQLHRFHDELSITACDHEEGATIYLSLAQAKAIRAGMGRIIRSIERERYACGSLTVELQVRDKRYSQSSKVERAQS